MTAVTMERRWLPHMAPHLTLSVPAPVARGRPGHGYPLTWTVFEWIDGRPYAVIDFGSLGVRDPAAGVIAAWSVFGPAGRAVFRDALDVDEQTWVRARGFALHQAAMIIPYDAETNPAFVAMAKRTVEQVIASVDE